MMKFTDSSHTPRKALAGLVLVAFLAGLSLRAEEPTPSKAFYNTFNDEEEMAMGRQAAAETDKQMPLLEAPLLTAYVNSVGQKVAKASRRPEIQYTFKIVNTDTVNAFSLPGGFVYVHRGLLDFVVNESELAGVLAHEVGHVVAYHSMNDVARRYWADRVAYEAKKAGVVSDEQMADLLKQYGGYLVFVDRKFSREEESEADMLGMYNAIRAGYDPQGLVSALGRLSKFTGNPTLVEGLLMNHPLPDERVTALQAELKQNPPPTGLEKDSIAFRAAKANLKVLPPPPPPPKKE
ncbi:MAG TPA: M48 family metallopeptidase [Terriglobia bacterium]|nr:M48 family metallopeptidase [Terriglobia bacterium]